MVSYTYKTASGETECFLVKNQQGDVEKVISADGTVLAAYTYDAWGNILSAIGSLASANPIRYRGYYFDSETGLYYLHSRYYDPQTGRFINADDAAMMGADGDVQSYNLFTYCLNNPSSYVDQNGLWAAYIGGSIDVAAGWKIGGFAGVVFDGKGNKGVMVTVALGGGTLSASTTLTAGAALNADTIFDMQGLGISVGGSLGAGFDFTIGTSQKGDAVFGLQLVVPPDAVLNPNIELHGELTYTYVIVYDRLPVEVQQLVDKVLSEKSYLLNQNCLS